MKIKLYLMFNDHNAILTCFRKKSEPSQKYESVKTTSLPAGC